MKLFSKIERLKRRARNAYEKHQRIADGYSCGVSLAAVISPDLYEAAVEFNTAMSELKKLDENCPEFRPLPVG